MYFSWGSDSIYDEVTAPRELHITSCVSDSYHGKVTDSRVLCGFFPVSDTDHYKVKHHRESCIFPVFDSGLDEVTGPRECL